MSRSFSGTSQALYQPSFNVGSGAFTAAAWFNCTTPSSATPQSIIGQWKSSSAARFLMYVVSSKLNFVILGGDFNNQSPAAGATSISAGVWHHGAVSFQPSTALRLYLDGVEDSSLTSGVKSGLSAFTPGINVLQMGQDADGNNRFAGQLEQGAIWNVVLNAGEIAALAKGVRPSLIRPVRALDWPVFSSPVEVDVSGAGFPPTDFNTTAGTSNPPAGRFVL